MARANLHRLAQGFCLRHRHQTGMIVLVPGERQAEALDRISEEADGPVMLARRLEGLKQRGQIMAAEVSH